MNDAFKPFMGRTPLTAPGKVTWEAEGDANRYTLYKHGEWLMTLRVDGSLFVADQEALMQKICDALSEAPVEPNNVYSVETLDASDVLKGPV